MRLVVLLLASVVAGCAAPASAPGSAQAAPPDYGGWSCPQLHAEDTRLDAAAAALERRQDAVRTGEVAGILFLGQPPSTLASADHAAEARRLRGQQAAVRQALANGGCGA